MTQDDVLFGYRLQLFDLAARTNVSHACRTFGVHRSTYYRWKRQVDRSGLEMLRPKERRRPRMPNAFPQIVEERILAFANRQPGARPTPALGPARASIGDQGLAERDLEGASPLRSFDPGQAARSRRRLPRSL